MFVHARNRNAFDPREPFSRAEARAAGLTAEMLLSKRFHKIFWDAYVSRDVPITPLLRAKAVIRLVPIGSYISHHTAAELWGAAPPLSGATHITLPSPLHVKYGRESARTIARGPAKPRFVRACRSRLQSRHSWTSLESASGL
jgi:hypothetical protein